MAIKRKNRAGRIEIDIDGPEGNAYCLLGYAKQYAKQLEFDWEEIKSKMTESDYNNLLLAFNEYFGDFVDLVTENKEFLNLLNNDEEV